VSNRSKDFRLAGRLIRQARPFWWHLMGIALLSLLSAPLALLTPLPLKIAVDSVLGSAPLPGFLAVLVPAPWATSATALLIFAATMLVAIIVLQRLQGFASWVIELSTGEHLALDFRRQLFRHAQRLSLSYHDRRSSGDSLYRIQYDAAAMQYITIQGLIPLLTAGVTLVALLSITAHIDAQLALIALAVTPALFVLSEYYRRRVRERWSEVKRLESSAMSVIQETLGSLRVVKAFGREDREEERFVAQARRGVVEQVRVVFAESAFGLLVAVTIGLGMASVLVVGVRHVQAGLLSLGALLVVMAYVAELYKPLETISKKVTELQGALASAERAFALFDESPDVPERPGARALGRADGVVEFRDVTFGYDEDRPVLRGVSFRVPAGTCVGIVGDTGAGKSTLMGLLPRFFDPSEGSVLLDGVDLRDYRLADLRNQFAIVLQEPLLLSTSVEENIAYGRPHASPEEVRDAARAAHIHSFIESLPRGYDTQVGERGMRLSGGERQRIALARAFLKDAPLLILDEPTSSVDFRSEAQIMEAMTRLTAGRTTFMIAHRVATLDRCSFWLRVEGGRVEPTRPGCDSSHATAGIGSAP
jgi:ATP-binding cassette subfamily B protein